MKHSTLRISKRQNAGQALTELAIASAIVLMMIPTVGLLDKMTSRVLGLYAVGSGVAFQRKYQPKVTSNDHLSYAVEKISSTSFHFPGHKEVEVKVSTPLYLKIPRTFFMSGDIEHRIQMLGPADEITINQIILMSGLAGGLDTIKLFKTFIETINNAIKYLRHITSEANE